MNVLSSADLREEHDRQRNQDSKHRQRERQQGAERLVDLRNQPEIKVDRAVKHLVAGLTPKTDFDNAADVTATLVGYVDDHFDAAVLARRNIKTGADLGLCDFGSYALNAMRIEKGYHGWGSEFGVEYTPFDVGLDRFLALDKPEFVGRDAVLAVADGPAAWSYGVWTVDVSSMPGPVGDPPPSAPIRIGGQPVGFVTSSSMGFRTGRRVCLGYVEGRHAATTAGFTIDGYGADLPAERHASGIYDPEHHRLRG